MHHLFSFSNRMISFYLCENEKHIHSPALANLPMRNCLAFEQVHNIYNFGIAICIVGCLNTMMKIVRRHQMLLWTIVRTSQAKNSWTQTDSKICRREDEVKIVRNTHLNGVVTTFFVVLCMNLKYERTTTGIRKTKEN